MPKSFNRLLGQSNEAGLFATQMFATASYSLLVFGPVQTVAAFSDQRLYFFMREGYQEIYYADKATPVRLGDEVEARVLFRKTTGRVAYVPGLSEKNPEMEFNGLTYVGIKTVDQGILGVTVMPNNFNLEKKIKFIRRDPDGQFEKVKPNEALFEDEDGNPF